MLSTYYPYLKYLVYVGIIYLLLLISWTILKVIVFRNIVRAISKIFPTGEPYSASKKVKKTPPKKPESKYLEKESEAKEVEVEVLEAPTVNLEYNRTKVVGVVKNAVVGKFTAIFAKKFLSNIMNLDIKQVRDLGYFQAKILAERQAAMGIQKNSRGF